VAGLLDKKVPEAVALSADDLEGLWNDLTGTSATNAYRAILRLTACGRESVPFLKQRLKSGITSNEPRMVRLIKDLDDDEFTVREKAAQELESLGPRAEAALRRALEGRPSTEVRSRVGHLLKKLKAGAPLPSADLIGLRVLEVFENADTQAAQQVLKELANGAPEALLTRQAKASLDRLAKRPVKP
jgi:hypothetical protein